MDLSLSSRLNLSITSGEIESYHRDGSGGFGECVGHGLGGTDEGGIKVPEAPFISEAQD